MQDGRNIREIRQRIRLLQELPPLPVMAQKILSLSNDDTDIKELADTIEKDPCLSARLLGLANAAYFGWPGGVRTMYDAIYKVLGLKMVKSLAIGLILGGTFRADKCKNFSIQQYWFTAVATALMTQNLLPHISSEFRNNLDNIYLDGLLHNLGLPVLVHLFPLEMEQVFSLAGARSDRPVNECAKEVLAIDTCQAGGWLARKWHLPEDIICVIDHHKNCGYRNDFWPIVLLVGYCARSAKALFFGTRSGQEPEIPALLGICEEAAESQRRKAIRDIEGISEMAALLSGNGPGNG
ncbi:MAG TPA: HDOD domain-containing protein [Geobacteraceae bacterium]|nr:HDOD domain-containing protein [Geobacteraceae bacterium]